MRSGTAFERSSRTLSLPGTVKPRSSLAEASPSRPRTITSATAGPASGLASSSTELCRVPAPTPVNQVLGLGCGQSTAARRRSPNLAPISPGARSPSPSATTGPVGRHATHPAGTHRHRRLLPGGGHGHLAAHVRLTGGDVRRSSAAGRRWAGDGRGVERGRLGRTVAVDRLMGLDEQQHPDRQCGQHQGEEGGRRQATTTSCGGAASEAGCSPSPPPGRGRGQDCDHHDREGLHDEQPDPQPGIRPFHRVRVDGAFDLPRARGPVLRTRLGQSGRRVEWRRPHCRQLGRGGRRTPRRDRPGRRPRRAPVPRPTTARPGSRTRPRQPGPRSRPRPWWSRRRGARSSRARRPPHRGSRGSRAQARASRSAPCTPGCRCPPRRPAGCGHPARTSRARTPARARRAGRGRRQRVGASAPQEARPQEAVRAHDRGDDEHGLQHDHEEAEPADRW